MSVELATFLAAFARTAAFMRAAPIVGDMNVPTKVKVSAAAAVALGIYQIRPQIAPEDLTIVLPAEILMGVAIGFAGRVVLAGAQAGGQLLAMQMGLGMANTFDPNLGETAVVTRRLTLVFASLAFLSVGGLQGAVMAVAYAPAPDAFNLAGAGHTIIYESSQVLEVAVKFAAPAMVAGLITNLGVAVSSKAAPAMNIFSVMLVALLIVGGLVLLATGPMLMKQISLLAERTIDVMAGVSGL